jgi:hypothetical protein|tara:strand:+ start:512 stop:724 length:213 start_codon:yes stop_codon:yes gene_type:complete
MASVPTGQTDTDDWFDLDKYREAAGVAYEFSKKKLEDKGEETRKTIGYQDDRKRRDEERDYQQAQRAYKY